MLSERGGVRRVVSGEWSINECANMVRFKNNNLFVTSDNISIPLKLTLRGVVDITNWRVVISVCCRI
jgi:hypothetical protein